MIANGQKLEWEGGSFSPNAKRVGHGTGGGRLAKNITRWSSEDPVQAARLFVGFNVGDQPVYSMSHLVGLVREVRETQAGDPSSSFVSQRGIYRHEAGDVIEEDGAQVILINAEFIPEEQFRDQIIALAETIAGNMKQDEVIVEMQKGGVTLEVLGVGAEMAANADWEASARVAYRGRLTGGEPVEHTLETRADEPERELTLANRNGRAYWQPPELRGKRYLERERSEREEEEYDVVNRDTGVVLGTTATRQEAVALAEKHNKGTGERKYLVIDAPMPHDVVDTKTGRSTQFASRHDAELFVRHPERFGAPSHDPRTLEIVPRTER